MNFNFTEIELRKIDLNLLLVFSAVMRTGSGNAAAKRLYLAPSAVSMALGRLRAAVGQDLFVRAKHGLEPTERAKALYARIGPALENINAALTEDRNFDPTRSDRTIRFGISDDLEMVLVPALIARLALEAPRMSLVLRAADYQTAPHLTKEGLVDLAVTAAPVRRDASHRIVTLYSETFVAVWNPSVLDLPEPLTLDAYLETPHVLASALGAPLGIIDAALDRCDMRRRVHMVVERFSTLPLVLAATPMLGNVPSLPARHLAAAFGLVCRTLPFEGPTFDVSAIWHARSDKDAAHAWFRQLVRTQMQELRTTPFE